MNNIITSRQTPQDSFTFEFGVADAANVLFSLLDPSGNRNAGPDISGGTTVFEFNEDSPALVCPITLENVSQGESVMRINRCGHRFRESALRRWLENHQRCPVCRGHI